MIPGNGGPYAHFHYAFADELFPFLSGCAMVFVVLTGVQTTVA